MKNGLATAVSGITLLAISATIGCTPSRAHQFKTNQVRISYVSPTHPTHQELYELLKERRSLEKVQEFLSPFRLEWPLNIVLTECDGEADAMYSDNTITICYEYIEALRKYMPAETTPAGIEPVDTLVGPFMDTVLHEFAHALFDYLDTPVLGREEDAADHVSACIYLQMNKAEARRLIMGTVYTYLMDARNAGSPSMADFADEHSTPEQRAFNLVCMAYGSDPVLFADLPALTGLPQERTDACEEEYELISLAYRQLIGPHIDADLEKKLLDKTWLPEKTSSMMSTPH